MRRTLVLALVVAAAIFVVPASQAITDGEPDEDGHPYVGLMMALDEDGYPLWSCSGSLLSSTVFLTAGHCVAPNGDDEPARVEIWFDDGYLDEIPFGTYDGGSCAGHTGYPCAGDRGGEPIPIPGYAFPTRDLGIVQLDSSYPLSEYGQLPTAGQLDALKTKHGVRRQVFDSVGYGLQRSFPDAASWKDEDDRTRMVSHPYLIQINVPGFTGDFSMLLSNHKPNGGSCFGDSGGPNLLEGTNIIAGITSFGIPPTCAGTGGVYRLDRSWNLDWLEDSFGITPPP